MWQSTGSPSDLRPNQYTLEDIWKATPNAINVVRHWAKIKNKKLDTKKKTNSEKMYFSVISISIIKHQWFKPVKYFKK